MKDFVMGNVSPLYQQNTAEVAAMNAHAIMSVKKVSYHWTIIQYLYQRDGVDGFGQVHPYFSLLYIYDIYHPLIK